MKRQTKRLMLSRETLRALNLHHVVGGYEPTGRTRCETHCASNCTGCAGEGGSDPFATAGADCLINTSTGCATGGTACTGLSCP